MCRRITPMLGSMQEVKMIQIKGTKKVLDVAIFTNLSVLAPSLLLLETTQTRRAGPNEGLAIRKATLDFPQKRIRNRK